MRVDTLERSAGVLVPVIVLLLGSAVLAAVLKEPAPAGEEGVPASTAPPSGPLARPELGVHRYQVTTDEGGEDATTTETRTIRHLEGRPGEANIEVTTEADGQQQVSRMIWSAEGVVVRSTTLASASAGDSPCTWQPPITEFGELAAGASWTVDSSCTTTIDGFETTIEVEGTTSVRAPAEIDVAGRSVAVWELTRDRTTRVISTVGRDLLDQIVREAGTLYLDPSTGLVVRADVRVTVSGARSEEYRRRTVYAGTG